MASQLTEDQIAVFKEAFSLYDRDNDGIISINELGLTPTEEEIQEIKTQVDTGHKGIIDFPRFLDVLSRKLKETESEESVIQSFRVFDKEGSGFIGSQELRHILTSLGDKLSDEEAEALIREADPSNTGKINYVNFVKKVSRI